jgi:O-antigen ligase
MILAAGKQLIARSSPAIWGGLLALLLGIGLALLPLTWAALLVLVSAFLVLVLVDPLLGLAAMLLFAPFGAFEDRMWGSRVLDSGQLLFLLTMTAWLARGMARREVRLRLSPVHLPLALYVGVGLLSLLDALSLPAGFRELLKWVEIGLLMAVAGDMLRTSSLMARVVPADSPWRPRLLLGLLLLPGLSQAAGGIWQAVLRGSGPDHFLVAGRFYRPYGTFDQPNPFGGFVAMTACLAIGAFVGAAAAAWRARSWGSKRERLWLLVLAGAALITSTAVLLSWSRGAWLGFAAGIAAIGFFWPRRRRVGVVLLAAAAVVAWLALTVNLVPASVTARLASISTEFNLRDVRGVDINDQNFSVLERLAHWQSAQAMARTEPWLGIGLGNYEAAYADHALLNWPAALGHAHNIYLNVLAETGVAGIISYLILWAVVFGQAIFLTARLDGAARGIALGALGVWTTLAVHQLVDNLYVNNIFLFLGVLMGLQQLLAQDLAAVAGWQPPGRQLPASK